MRVRSSSIGVPLCILFFSAALAAQDFKILEQRAFQKSRLVNGVIEIVRANIYRIDGQSGKVSKFAPSGEQIFAELGAPRVGRVAGVNAVTEDRAGNIYVSDGVNIHIYTPQGKYQKSITPGLNIATNGLLALDEDHLYVAGRFPRARGAGSATVHEIVQGRIARSFSDVFSPNRTGMEDILLNTDSVLALDSRRSLIYQLPQYLYEIRAYLTTGEYVRTILPPREYQTRSPRIRRTGEAVGLDPSDSLTGLFVLPDGSLAVEGLLLEQMNRVASHRVRVRYSIFVDLFDSSGSFRQRLREEQLRLPSGAGFLGIDGSNGHFYFLDDSTLYIATLIRQGQAGVASEGVGALPKGDIVDIGRSVGGAPHGTIADHKSTALVPGPWR